MKLNLGSGPVVLEGFDNLDPSNGWRFEDGLPYADAVVEGITISHALMYLDISLWLETFREFARVLEPNGIVRITEDDCENEESERYGSGVWFDAVTTTGPRIVRKYLLASKFAVDDRGIDETGFRDFTLCQALHGEPPKVFFIEGRKRKPRGRAEQ